MAEGAPRKGGLFKYIGQRCTAEIEVSRYGFAYEFYFSLSLPTHRIFDKEVPKTSTTTPHNRIIVGTILGFDRHMNIILDNSEEFRTTTGRRGKKQNERRHLGLVLLNGSRLKSLSMESDPSPVPVQQERFPPEAATPAEVQPPMQQRRDAPAGQPVPKKRKLAAPSRGIHWKIRRKIVTTTKPHNTGVGAPDPSMMAPTQ